MLHMLQAYVPNILFVSDVGVASLHVTSISKVGVGGGSPAAAGGPPHSCGKRGGNRQSPQSSRGAQQRAHRRVGR
jgi:hypothetical protein